LIDTLRKRKAQSVVLQFPEGLKRQSAPIASALKKAGFMVVISGDPCYGACDLALDALAATKADTLVHFGHAPLDDHPQVVYDPWRLDFDVSTLAKATPFLTKQVIGLVTTVQHAHLIPEMERTLVSLGYQPRVADGAPRAPLRGQVLGCNFTAANLTHTDEILFVGTGSFHPIGIALSTKSRVVAFDPLTGTAQEISADTLLRRRHAIMERARGSKHIGIILSSKSGQNRRELATRLANLSQDAVIIEMKEVTPEEILNMGFDCYVNTACPRIAYDDQVRYAKPVLSPQEFEILCGVRTWDDYTIDEIV